jgi:hypothetical protein
LKVVITQPNFLPWLGYLAQIVSSDVFVVLDSVQFARREWQNRNRIISRQGKIDFLTANVKRSRRFTNILDTQIAEEYSPKKVGEKIAAFYNRCPRKKAGGEVCQPFYTEFHRTGRSLADANADQLAHLGQLMGVSTRFERATELEPCLRWETPTERLVAICRSLGATTYISSPSARGYMEDELHKFFDAGIEVLWQQFTHVPYIDSERFVSHLSCVDFLHHRPEDELLPYLWECNRLVAESDWADCK